MTADTTRLFMQVFLGAGIVAFAFGVWMVAHPASLIELNRRMSHWYSTRLAMKPLMIPHRTEPFFYRHHRLTGIFVSLGSGYVLAMLIRQYNTKALMQVLLVGPVPADSPAHWLIPGAAIALGVLSACALVIGLILIVRPSELKRFEAWSNRRVSLRQATKPLDIMRLGPEALFTRYPRWVGGLTIAGSLYVIVTLWRSLYP